MLIWNAQNDWVSFRFQFARAVATHQLSFRTVGEFIGLQFGLVGFVLLPVVLSGVTLTAWRGYRSREPVAILLSTAVLVPFLDFLWKSLTLRVGDTWPMFLWPAGFAATAINLVNAAARRQAGLDREVDILVGEGGCHLRHRLRGRRILLLRRRALEFDRQSGSRRRRGRL